MLLDSDSSHIAARSQALAQRLQIQLLWLPKRSPELNPMDTLWGQAKDAVCANAQYTDIDQQADVFIAYLNGLSNRQALRTSGVLSKHFWLRRVLSKKLPLLNFEWGDERSFRLVAGVKGGRSPAQRTLDAGRQPVR